MSLLLLWVLYQVSGLPAATEHAESISANHGCRVQHDPVLSAHHAHDVKSHCVCGS